MIVRGFKSVLWVGAVGGAALSCYMVSLRVATERADLARVEHQIVDAKRDIRSLETELGTRGRLTQLEDWNKNVLALSAPSSAQFVKDGYTLARLETQQPTVQERSGEVRMASLETSQTAAPATASTAEKPKAAEAEKPKVAPAAPAAEKTTLPRIVEAVAAEPASHEAIPVRRASFDMSEPTAASTPSKSAKAKTATASATSAKVPAAKKVKSASTGEDATPPAKHETHRASRLAKTDEAPAKPVRPHAPAKLARADAAAHGQASGHRGGAQ